MGAETIWPLKKQTSTLYLSLSPFQPVGQQGGRAYQVVTAYGKGAAVSAKRWQRFPNDTEKNNRAAWEIYANAGARPLGDNDGYC